MHVIKCVERMKEGSDISWKGGGRNVRGNVCRTFMVICATLCFYRSVFVLVKIFTGWFHHKGPFTNTCKGGMMQKKKKISTKKKKFQGPLFDCKFFSLPPPFSPRKICINPTENRIGSIFRGKISMIFPGSPLLDL